MCHSFSRRGFTLLELSVVIVVLSIMVGGALTIITQQIRAAKQAELESKLAAIETALINFRKANNRLPCPADVDTALGNGLGFFGKEGDNTSSCAPNAVNKNFSDVGAPYVVAGVLPTKTLGLQENYMFDPWGGRFTYAVDYRVAAANAFTTYPMGDTAIGAITVYDNSTYPASTARTTKAIAVLISHGPNGHGAFQLSGARKNAGSSHADELVNCHCTNAGVTGTITKYFVQAANNTPATQAGNLIYTFDDVVRYYTRASISSSSDVIVEAQ